MSSLRKAIAVFVVGALALTQTAAARADNKGPHNREGGEGQSSCDAANFRDLDQFKLAKLEEKWIQYSGDKGFKALVDQAKSQGFQRIANNEKTAWGFAGKFTKDRSTNPVSAEVCAFDFAKQTQEGVQMASMVWRQVGGEVYRALIVFPVGEKDLQKAFAGAVEDYADDAGNVKRAHSFNTCFNSCLKTSAAFCGGLAGACFGFVTAVGISGVGLPAALGILGACAGICVMPIAICAVRC